MRPLTENDIAGVVQEVLNRLSGVPSSAAKPGGCGCETNATKTQGNCKCDAAPAPAEVAKASRQVLNSGADRVGCTGAGSLQCGDIASYIDHTMLKPDTTEAEIEKLCAEARAHKFASVCVNTSYVETCSRLLAGSGVKVCCVVGFPLGAMTSDSKAFETRDAVSHGAEEIDMVINVGKLQSGNFAYIFEDIRAVVKSAQGNPVKVILETALLDDTEKVAACVLAKAAGADFVKTSTGFSTGGATPEDIKLMRRVVGDQMGVKASGGIRDCETAQRMIESGATRLGASASVGIVKGKKSAGTY